MSTIGRCRSSFAYGTRRLRGFVSRLLWGRMRARIRWAVCRRQRGNRSRGGCFFTATTRRATRYLETPGKPFVRALLLNAPLATTRETGTVHSSRAIVDISYTLGCTSYLRTVARWGLREVLFFFSYSEYIRAAPRRGINFGGVSLFCTHSCIVLRGKYAVFFISFSSRVFAPYSFSFKERSIQLSMPRSEIAIVNSEMYISIAGMYILCIYTEKARKL